MVGVRRARSSQLTLCKAVGPEHVKAAVPAYCHLLAELLLAHDV